MLQWKKCTGSSGLFCGTFEDAPHAWKCPDPNCYDILDPQLDQSSSGGYQALGLLTFR